MASPRLPGNILIPRFTRSASLIAKTFSSVGGGSSYFFSIPSSPAARMTLKARYGLQAGSGERSSILAASGFLGLYMGIRTIVERLRRAQQI